MAFFGKYNALFNRKNRYFIYAFIVLVIFTTVLYLWSFFSIHLRRIYETFGTDGKLGLSYIYMNKNNKTGLKIFTLNDKMINSSIDTVYIPQFATAKNDDIINSPAIDMISSNNLYVIIQPHTKIIDPSNTENTTSDSPTPDYGWKNKNIDQFPILFDFKIRIDLLLNSNYIVDLIEPVFNVNTVTPMIPPPTDAYTYTMPGSESGPDSSIPGSVPTMTIPKRRDNYVPNKIFKNKSKSIGLVNLGDNSLHIYGQGDIIDDNNIRCGTVRRQVDDRKDPGYLIFDISMTSLSSELDSIVFNFGPVFPFSGLGGGNQGSPQPPLLSGSGST